MVNTDDLLLAMFNQDVFVSDENIEKMEAIKRSRLQHSIDRNNRLRDKECMESNILDQYRHVQSTVSHTAGDKPAWFDRAKRVGESRHKSRLATARPTFDDVSDLDVRSEHSIGVVSRASNMSKRSTQSEIRLQNAIRRIEERLGTSYDVSKSLIERELALGDDASYAGDVSGGEVARMKRRDEYNEEKRGIVENRNIENVRMIINMIAQVIQGIVPGAMGIRAFDLRGLTKFTKDATTEGMFDDMSDLLMGSDGEHMLQNKYQRLALKFGVLLLKTHSKNMGDTFTDMKEVGEPTAEELHKRRMEMDRNGTRHSRSSRNRGGHRSHHHHQQERGHRRGHREHSGGESDRFSRTRHFDNIPEYDDEVSDGSYMSRRSVVRRTETHGIPNNHRSKREPSDSESKVATTSPVVSRPQTSKAKPKEDTKEVEAPKPQTPKVQTPKVQTPKAKPKEVPKVEAPKVEAHPTIDSASSDDDIDGPIVITGDPIRGSDKSLMISKNFRTTVTGFVENINDSAKTDLQYEKDLDELGPPPEELM